MHRASLNADAGFQALLEIDAKEDKLYCSKRMERHFTDMRVREDK